MFFDWHFGWDSRGENIFLFWAKNLGLFIPLLALGIYFVFRNKNQEIELQINADKHRLNQGSQQSAIRRQQNKLIHHSPFTIHHLLFYVPFLLCFIVPNLVRLAPWEWDNIKVLIYWFVGSVPFVALVLARLWERKAVFKFVAAACLIVLTLTGALDIWRVASRAVNYQVFEPDSVKIAEQIKQKTPPLALFLNAPTYNTAVVLSGRRSLMRYTGHLSSYAIDYEPRESEVKRIYEGSAASESLLKKYNIDYILISPEERGYEQTNNMRLNEDYFRRFPVVAEVGQYRVYKVK
jgi:hypothetical protein